VKILDDGWTVSTADGSLAAHWENTIAVMADGPIVLTASNASATIAGAASPAGEPLPVR
jgi:methionyl aminopeptidase